MKGILENVVPRLPATEIIGAMLKGMVLKANRSQLAQSITQTHVLPAFNFQPAIVKKKKKKSCFFMLTLALKETDPEPYQL